jgi:alcohol dehydrogenase
MPIISVNDPMFMTTMPLEVTAACGLDVFSHAIEAFVATEASPITDNLALGAMKGVFRYLRHAYENGNNLEAREQMMFANCMAGMAFNNAGLGYIHAMSHQVGGVYNQIHGVINSVLIPHVLNFNAPAIPHERLFSICEAIGIKAKDKSDAVDKIMSSVQNLCEDVGLPNHLEALGVKEEDLEFMAKNAEKDICSFTSPKKGTFVDIIDIYKAAM